MKTSLTHKSNVRSCFLCPRPCVAAKSERPPAGSDESHSSGPEVPTRRRP
jgi:hypothetical protein